MKLPNGNQAIIDPAKILEYCLNPEHDDGRHKARLFQNLVGLTQANADLLFDALRQAAANGDARYDRKDEYGQRYVIDFELTGPKGAAVIRSAWIIRTNEDVPPFVTCYIL